eukprot:Gb_11436 [translate_table: standard]
MPRISERVKEDLGKLGAWWFFKDFTLIRVEECNFGVARRCKHANQKPYPHLLFAIGDMFFQNWLVLEKVVREIEGMNLPHRGSRRQWDPFGRVQGHLATLHAKVSVDYQHQPSEEEDMFNLCPSSWEEVQQRIQVAQRACSGEEESEETDEVLARQLLRGLPTGRIEVQSPITTTASLFSSSIPPPPHVTLQETGTTSQANTSISLPKTPGTVRTSRGHPTHHYLFELGRTPHIDPIDIAHLEDAQSATSQSTVSRSQWIQMQLANAEEMGLATPKPPEVILEYDRATNSLKRVTKRKIMIGAYVTTFQTEENLLSLTRKRKRTTWSTDMDDRELIADPVCIVLLANKMSEKAVERMQLELAQSWDRIVAPPSMGAEITCSIKDLYQSFVQIEEARAKGEETHRRIGASLEQINEWESKLATLKNVAHRNLLLNLSLLELDEVITCENALAKTKQVLEVGDAPLVSSNRQLESSSRNIRTLLDSAGLPPVVKLDNSPPSEIELDATLGEFTTQFARGGMEGGKGIVFQGVFEPCLGRAYPDHGKGSLYIISDAISRPTLNVTHLRMKSIVRDRPRTSPMEKVQCTDRGPQRPEWLEWFSSSFCSFVPTLSHNQPHFASSES